MVKKSLLARLFGKKEAGETESKKNPKKSLGKPGISATGTATLPKKEEGSRITGMRDKDRFQQDKERGTVKPTGRKDGSANEDRGKGKPPALEPEIHTPPGKVTERHEKKMDVIAEKMSAQEEVSVKISDGIKGLSSVLSNIDQRLEEQTQQSCELAKTVKIIPEAMKDLPESSRAGLELLQTISQILENQSKATANLGSQVAGLPDVITRLNEKMDHDAADRVEDRAAFKESFKDSVSAMNASIKELEKRQSKIDKNQFENTKKIVDHFRTVQKDQQRNVRDLIQKSKLTNTLVAVLILVIVAGLVGLFIKFM